MDHIVREAAVEARHRAVREATGEVRGTASIRGPSPSRRPGWATACSDR